MALVKFAPDISPLIGEHSGFTFQYSRIGSVMFKGQANDRNRYTSQNLRKQNLTNANGHWRNLSAESKAAWSLFAATIPQSPKRWSETNLNGYQCFIKRQSYLFLNYGVTADFMQFPGIDEFYEPDIDFSLAPGLFQVDVTDLFIDRFGILPSVGDYLLFQCVICVKENGQVFDPFKASLFVDSLLSGRLFISINSSDDLYPFTVSLFLSRVISQGRIYDRSLSRYVGFFEMPVPFYPIGFGCLYSKECFLQSNSVLASGWSPLDSQFIADLIAAFGGFFDAGLHLKDITSDWWDSSTTRGDNSSLFSARGSGFINEFGYSTDFRFNSYSFGFIFDSDPSVMGWLAIYPDSQASYGTSIISKKLGFSARAMKIDEGEQYYTGNDGKIYPVIRFFGFVVTACALAETLFNDGSPIPLATSPSEWLSLPPACYAAPEYDSNNI